MGWGEFCFVFAGFLFLVMARVSLGTGCAIWVEGIRRREIIRAGLICGCESHADGCF